MFFHLQGVGGGGGQAQGPPKYAPVLTYTKKNAQMSQGNRATLNFIYT